MGIIAERIKMIKAGENPYYVAELRTGYVVIGDHQNFRGYSLLLCKEPAIELHYLDDGLKGDFLNEMSLVTEAVDMAFSPQKTNILLLGNADPHLHWHIIPRYADDPFEGKGNPMDLLAHGIAHEIPKEEDLSKLKQLLLQELEKIAPDHIVHRFSD